MSLRALKESLKESHDFVSGSTSGSSSSFRGPANDAQTDRKPVRTSIREQIASLEGWNPRTASERVHGKRPRCEPEEDGICLGGQLGLRMEVPLLKKHCGSAKEELELEEDLAILGRDSEAGLFIHSSSEGPFEPLVLWPVLEEGSSTGPGHSERVEVPASINSRLLEHQREGVKFLYTLYREKRGGILGDDMGLGKTIQTIAFIAAILKKDGGQFQLPFQVSRSRSKRISTEMDCDRPPMKKVVLILCPTSVIENWQREFEAWGTFALGIYHGSQREAIVTKIKANELDVVVTSHDTFRIHGRAFQEIDWDCVFVDEAHRLKSEKSQLYKACAGIHTRLRYGLTGTIMQNKLLDLFNVFDWAAPGCLGTKEHFRGFYDEPIKQGQRISAPDTLVELAETRRLHLLDVLQKHLLRRTKQDTIGHLLRGKEDIIVFCAMSSVQKRVYTRLLESPDFQCLVKKDQPCSCGSFLVSSKCCFRTAPKGIIWPYLHRDKPDGCESCPYCLVLPCLTKLQQVSNHLELLKPNPNDDIEKRKRDEAFSALVFGDDATLLGGTKQDESFLSLSDAQHCGKMLALKNLLTTWTSQGDKVLLFSYSVRMLGILEKFLIRRGYSFARLDGSTPMSARQGIVDNFNNSPSKQVFLISTRAGGLGLNLVSANRVVVFDPNWNPAQDLQAQDRSFRFGQKRHVTVFRLLAAGSLEELIYTRQIYKQQLFNIAVTGTLEKRYFEGVQDSKVNKGELFGVTNLFRDLQEKVFTSDIIKQHEERLMTIKIHANNERNHKTRKKKAEDNEDEDDHGLSSLAELVKADMQDLKIEEDEPESGNAAKERTDISHILTDAGVVYAHRNEEVVNMGLRGQERLKQMEARDTEEDTEKSDIHFRGSKATSKNTTTEEDTEKADIHSRGSKATTRTRSKNTKPELLVASSKRDVEKLKKRPVKAEDKNSQFLELAKFKGLDERAFSKWLLSASQVEREQLLADYRGSR